MSAQAPIETHKARALALANRGIQSGAEGDHQTARTAWRAALDYAERHLPGDDIVLWIRSGLGDTLLQCGDYRGAAEMAGTALAFCAANRAPLALLTMIGACLGLGDVPSARMYARQAVALRGAAVLTRLSPADRDRLGPLD